MSPTPDRGLPKYREIAERFRTRILEGDLRPGDEVPSERALAAEYDVSRPTATRALELLRHEGVVESRQGSGTFVADLNRRPKDRYKRARTRGRIYGAGEKAVILAAEVVESPPAHVRKTLGVTGAVVRRRRVTLLDDAPQEVSTSWFDAALVSTAPKLVVAERIRAGTLAYVEEATGRTARYARDRMSARAAGAEDAKDLSLRGGKSSPVLAVEHIVFDEHDMPLEFVEAVYPADRWTHEQRYDLS